MRSSTEVVQVPTVHVPQLSCCPGERWHQWYHIFSGSQLLEVTWPMDPLVPGLLYEKVPGPCTPPAGPQLGYAPVLLSTNLSDPWWELGAQMPFEAAMKPVHGFAQWVKCAFSSSPRGKLRVNYEGDKLRVMNTKIMVKCSRAVATKAAVGRAGLMSS